MKRHLIWTVVLTAFFGLGLSLPGCPGGQAVQQQIDSLSTNNAEMIKKIQILENNMNRLNNDFNRLSSLLNQMGTIIQKHDTALNSVNTAMSAKPAAMAKGKAKFAPAKKKKGR